MGFHGDDLSHTTQLTCRLYANTHASKQNHQERNGDAIVKGRDYAQINYCCPGN